MQPNCELQTTPLAHESSPLHSTSHAQPLGTNDLALTRLAIIAFDEARLVRAVGAYIWAINRTSIGSRVDVAIAIAVPVSVPISVTVAVPGSNNAKATGADTTVFAIGLILTSEVGRAMLHFARDQAEGGENGQHRTDLVH